MPAPLVAAIATDAASERRAQDSATFPEAATAVSMLGTHAAKWSREHFEEALRVLLWMHARRDEGSVVIQRSTRKIVLSRMLMRTWLVIQTHGDHGQVQQL